MTNSCSRSEPAKCSSHHLAQCSSTFAAAAHQDAHNHGGGNECVVRQALRRSTSNHGGRSCCEGNLEQKLSPWKACGLASCVLQSEVASTDESILSVVSQRERMPARYQRSCQHGASRAARPGCRQYTGSPYQFLYAAYCIHNAIHTHPHTHTHSIPVHTKAERAPTPSHSSTAQRYSSP
jgi:hypothetical protein